MRHTLISAFIASLLLSPASLRGQEFWPELEYAVLEGVADLLGLALVEIAIHSEPLPPDVVNEVRFASAPASRRSSETAVRVFVDSGVTRQELEDVLSSHEVLARSQITVRSRSADSSSSARAWMRSAAQWVQALGGDAVLVTRRSELIGVLMQNVRYSGPPDEVVLYALRRLVRTAPHSSSN